MNRKFSFNKSMLFAGLLSAMTLGATSQVYAVQSRDVQKMQQQTVKLTGNVSDAMGAIIGASVIEQGTTNGVITDIEGNFTLTVNRGAKLEISYVGYKTRVIEVTDVTHLQITLEEDYRELEEVVVVGYGVQKKKLVTGATVQVKGDDVTKLNTTSALGALQNQTPGIWKIQCKLPPKTKRFCPLKTFNNAPLKSLDRWGYYYFSLFPSVCSHFTDTFSCQLNPVRRMYNTIHNGICYCRVSDCIIPIVRWQLRGDDDGLAPMSVLYYIEQDGSFLGIKVHKEEVIQYEQRAPFDSLEFRFQCAFYFCHLKRTHKFRSIRIICPYALLAGFIPHCCGKEALPGTG